MTLAPATRPVRADGRKREDLGGRYFRSRWEANYARYLDWLKAQRRIVRWAYEAHEFWFPIARGTRSYTPDFLVDYADGRHEWHEVKGFLDAQSKTRLARMAKYFPAERVVVIDAAWFRAANKQLAFVVPGWERGR